MCNPESAKCRHHGIIRHDRTHRIVAAPPACENLFLARGSCCRSTRRRSSGRWIGPNPACRCKRGFAATMAHDDQRHSTPPRFAALHASKGPVVVQNTQRHRDQAFGRVLNRIDHRRCPLHLRPTSCASRNAVAGFFAKPTRRRLSHGVFASRVDLEAGIMCFVPGHAVETRKTPVSDVPVPPTSSPPESEGSRGWIQSTSLRRGRLARSVGLAGRFQPRPGWPG